MISQDVSCFEDAYYASKKKEDLSERELRVSDALNLIMPGLKNDVERCYKQWNNVIRSALRHETALRMTEVKDKADKELDEGDETGKMTKRSIVPVKVTDGVPLPLLRIFDHPAADDPFFWELLLHKDLLKQTKKGVEFIIDNIDEIEDLVSPSHIIASSDEFNGIREYLCDIIKFLEEIGFQKKLREINEDVLGAYFFKVPEIHLYWMAIGLLSLIQGISVEGLTFVVLSHELAHAYTHLANDIDGENWATPNFQRCELPIVEGLAQFYTAQICKNNEYRFPSAKAAFEDLLEMQSEPYRDFLNWPGAKAKPGEIVRLGMLQTRKWAVEEYTKFKGILSGAEGQFLNGKKGRKAKNVSPF